MFGRARQAAPDPVGAPLRPVELLAKGVAKHIDENVLLAPVDLRAGSGQCVVLRGANGSGKTTLLRILAGTLDPTEGTATLDGTRLDERDPATRSRVAALIGAPTAYRDLTLIDHLVLIDSTWGGDIGTADERCDAILQTLEIGHLDERFPHELSSGQQQLFHLAMVLLRPARVLLLDEPEQRLDTHKREVLTRVLVERKASGTALVVACHDPALTEAIADRIIDIAGG